METLNANAIYQKKFRNKKAEEKKRVENLIENYSILSHEKILVDIKKYLKKNICINEGKFCVVEKYGVILPILEKIEYLAISLKMTAEFAKAEKLNSKKKELREAELKEHRSKIKKINKADSNSIFYLMTL